jgi:CspA family cold shock protein
MSKGNNFRPPRKRGFDDDDTSGGFDRPRGPRFGGAPGGEFGAPSPMGGAAGGPVATGPSVNATVKWFKGEKGYGFVELADGAGDAFLHANALQASGHESVPAGAKLVVQVGQGAKGAQVTRVLEVDTANIVAPARTPRPGFGDRPDRGGFGGGGGGGGFGGDARPRRVAPDPATAVPLAGKVKWFDETKGFGFVASEDGGKDVFVHISVLGAAGITRLTEGQPVMMKVVNTPKGREAISLSTSAS